MKTGIVTKPMEDNKARTGKNLPKKHVSIPADIQPPPFRKSNSAKQE
jgi:hypothetical protein